VDSRAAGTDKGIRKRKFKIDPAVAMERNQALRLNAEYNLGLLLVLTGHHRVCLAHLEL
jgi:hypothetical protein